MLYIDTKEGWIDNVSGTRTAESSPRFRPERTIMKVHPGAANATVFFARNPMAEPMVAQAIPSVSPARAAEYFHKTECFCFTEQPFQAGEEREMPLVFSISPDLPDNIKTISLSYTFYDKTPKNQVAQLTIQGE